MIDESLQPQGFKRLQIFPWYSNADSVWHMKMPPNLSLVNLKAEMQLMLFVEENAILEPLSPYKS